MAEQFEVKILVDLEVDNAAQSAVNQTLNQLRQGTTGLDGQINKVQNSLNGAQRSQKAFNAELSTTRYALYDVASTLAGTGVALLGLATATFGVAIAWERDFAQVVRTTGVVGDAVGKLRTDLVDLAQTMPVAFGNIAEIATLAGQLGVAQENVASFTETVAKFSAVTDLSVDEAATAFGRLDALLPDVRGNYEALGSSIAKVGVNSVATESQIVAISTQISSMGNFAGLTAAEVVGLSGALASVGAAPEISRGTLTRVFTQMQKAISEGGDSLQRFASIAGVSGDEFASAFGTNRFGPIFQKFIKGLNDTSKTGGDATSALRDLGITSVRDVPLLLRLAGAGNVLSQSMDDARVGFEQGTELNRQYGIIAETTAAKLQVLANNFMALLDAIGSANLGPLGDALDAISGFLGFLTDVASTDVGSSLLGVVAIMTGFIGVLGIAAGAMALFGASSIGMQQALVGLVTVAPRASAAVLGTGTATAIASGEMKAGAASARLLLTALKALSFVAVALVAIDVGNWVQGMIDAANGVDNLTGATDDSINRIKDSAGGIKDLIDQVNDGVTGASGYLTGELKTALSDFDREMKEAFDAGDIDGATAGYERMRKALYDLGVPANIIGDVLRDYRVELDKSAASASAAGDATATAVDPTQELADAEQDAADKAEVFAASLGLTTDAVDVLKENLSSGSQAFFDMSQAIKDATDEGTFSFNEFVKNLEEQVKAQQGFADNLGALAARGATNFVSELSKLGPEGAQVAAEAVSLTDAELAHLEGLARIRANNSGEAWAEGFTASIPVLQTAYNFGGQKAVESMQKALAKGDSAVLSELQKMARTAAAHPIPISASDRSALNTLNALMREINSRTGTVTIYAAYADGALQTIRDPSSYKDRKATGGPIYGPGTGTSDSVPIWASNGEYMMRASAVSKYGMSFMNAVNSGRMPKFASGGPIGGSAPATSGVGMGITELGPKTMKNLAREVAVNVMLDDVSISRAAQRGDRKRRSMGDLN